MDTQEEYDYLMKQMKDIFLNLPTSQDKIDAAMWIAKLSGVDDLDLKLPYARLLMEMLELGVVLHPFNEEPPADLQPLDPELTEPDAIHTLLADRARHVGSGDRPPIRVETSPDKKQYAAAQLIPRFGVHCYLAVAKEPLSEWRRPWERASASQLDAATRRAQGLLGRGAGRPPPHGLCADDRVDDDVCSLCDYDEDDEGGDAGGGTGSEEQALDDVWASAGRSLGGAARAPYSAPYRPPYSPAYAAAPCPGLRPASAQAYSAPRGLPPQQAPQQASLYPDLFSDPQQEPMMAVVERARRTAEKCSGQCSAGKSSVGPSRPGASQSSVSNLDLSALRDLPPPFWRSGQQKKIDSAPPVQDRRYRYHFGQAPSQNIRPVPRLDLSAMRDLPPPFWRSGQGIPPPLPQEDDPRYRYHFGRAPSQNIRSVPRLDLTPMRELPPPFWTSRRGRETNASPPEQDPRYRHHFRPPPPPPPPPRLNINPEDLLPPFWRSTHTLEDLSQRYYCRN